MWGWFFGLVVLVVIVLLSLHYTCTWSMFDSECLCQKKGKNWVNGKCLDPVVCSKICEHGTLVDCQCICYTGYMGDECQTKIQPPNNTIPIPNPTPNPDPVTIPNPTPTPNPVTIPIPTPNPIPNPIPIPVSNTISGTYMIKSPDKPLYLKTVGGSVRGNGQKLDDCKGNPGVCQWNINPVSDSIYNIKASDADLYLRTGGGAVWLAEPNWASDVSTQFEISRSGTDSYYFKPVNSGGKYFTIKGEWKQDAVPSVVSCADPTLCAWGLQKN